MSLGHFPIEPLETFKKSLDEFDLCEPFLGELGLQRGEYEPVEAQGYLVEQLLLGSQQKSERAARRIPRLELGLGLEWVGIHTL